MGKGLLLGALPASFFYILTVLLGSRQMFGALWDSSLKSILSCCWVGAPRCPWSGFCGRRCWMRGTSRWRPWWTCPLVFLCWVRFWCGGLYLEGLWWSTGHFGTHVGGRPELLIRREGTVWCFQGSLLGGNWPVARSLVSWFLGLQQWDDAPSLPEGWDGGLVDDVVE